MQVFLRITLISMKVICLNCSPQEQCINVVIWAFVTIGFELLTVFISLSKPLIQNTKDSLWYYASASIPVFAFRIVGWQVVILILADLSVIVFGVEIIINGLILYLMQREKLFLEPISNAIQSIIFPKVAFHRNIQKNIILLHILGALTIAGNLILMISLTVVFLLCSFNVYNLWNENDLRSSILISKNEFEIIYWCNIPLFFAATLPAIIEILISNFK